MQENASKFYQSLGISFTYKIIVFRFIVREFTYNEEELAAGKNEISKLVLDKKKQFVSFIILKLLFYLIS